MNLLKLDKRASFPPLRGVFSVTYLLQYLTEDIGCHNFLSIQHLWTDPVFTRCLSIFECFYRFSNFSFGNPIEVDINISSASWMSAVAVGSRLVCCSLSDIFSFTSEMSLPYLSFTDMSFLPGVYARMNKRSHAGG